MSLAHHEVDLEIRLRACLASLAEAPQVKVTDAPFWIVADCLSLELYHYLARRERLVVTDPSLEAWVVVCENAGVAQPWLVMTPLVSEPASSVTVLASVVKNHLQSSIVYKPSKIVAVYCLRHKSPDVLYAVTQEQRAKRAKYTLWDS